MPRRLPIEGARVSPQGSARGWLGERSDGARLHAGIDLGRSGDVVVAPESGTVVAAIDASYADDTPRHSTPPGWAGYGPRALLFRGLSGRWHLFAHLGSFTRQVGTRLEEGGVLGRVSQRSNHLHWEVRIVERPPLDLATVEIALDPVAWLLGRDELAPEVCPPNPIDDRHSPSWCRPPNLARERARAEMLAELAPERPSAPEPQPRARPTRPRLELDGGDKHREESESES